jgi:hypothetical protein
MIHATLDTTTTIFMAAGWLCVATIFIGLILSLVASSHTPGLILTGLGLVFLLGGKVILPSTQLESAGVLEILKNLLPNKLQKEGQLDKIAADYTAMTGWGKLVVYRIIIRQILTSICLSHNKDACDPNNPNISFETALYADKDVLSPKFFITLNHIRKITHYAEWGPVEPEETELPQLAQIKWVLEPAPGVIKSLQDIQRKNGPN